MCFESGCRVSGVGRRGGARGGGFSLMEVLVVLGIIGLILGIVAVNVMGSFRGARHDTAAAQVNTIVQAIDLFYLEHGRYPTTEEGIEVLTRPSAKTGEPLMKAVPKDPWGRAYEYNSPGLDAPYEVISYGADGQEGGDGDAADIVSSRLDGDGDA